MAMRDQSGTRKTVAESDGEETVTETGGFKHPEYFILFQHVPLGDIEMPLSSVYEINSSLFILKTLSDSLP